MLKNIFNDLYSPSLSFYSLLFYYYLFSLSFLFICLSLSTCNSFFLYLLYSLIFSSLSLPFSYFNTLSEHLINFLCHVPVSTFFWHVVQHSLRSCPNGQGDSMSLWKNHPKFSPTPFLNQNQDITFSMEWSSPKSVWLLLQLKKLPEEKYHPTDNIWPKSGHPEKRVSPRVARFFLEHDTKYRKNVPNEHKMYQIVIKYPKCP
jgi:hypothetical protein